VKIRYSHRLKFFASLEFDFFRVQLNFVLEFGRKSRYVSSVWISSFLTISYSIRCGLLGNGLCQI